MNKTESAFDEATQRTLYIKSYDLAIEIARERNYTKSEGNYFAKGYAESAVDAMKHTLSAIERAPK